MECVTAPETSFSKSKVLKTAQISTKRSSLVEVPPLLICRLVIHTTGGKWRHGAKANLNKGRNGTNVRFSIWIFCLPTHSLCWTHKWVFQNSKQPWGMHPHPKKLQDKDKQLICQAHAGTTRIPEGRNLSERAAAIGVIGRAARHKHQLHHHTPPPLPSSSLTTPPPRSLSCAQIGLKFAVPPSQNCRHKTC